MRVETERVNGLIIKTHQGYGEQTNVDFLGGI